MKSLVLRVLGAILPLAFVVAGILPATAAVAAPITIPVVAAASNGHHTTINVPTPEPMHRIRSGRIHATGGTTASFRGLTPAQIAKVYGFPTVKTALPIGISIVGHSPTLLTDVNATLKGWKLPPLKKCSTELTAGCLLVRNATGGTKLPGFDANWGLEETLDTALAHAFSPKSKIIVTEASAALYFDSGTDTGLGTGLTTLVGLGAKVINMSWASDEFDGQSDFATRFLHAKGVRYIAAGGDNSYGATFPGAATTVVSVGGTTLKLKPSGARASEVAWNATGGGCSQFTAKPANQTVDPCSGYRAQNDISAVANPDTGVKLTFQGSAGVIGGTSVAAPIISAGYALAGTHTTRPHTATYLYDVRSGSSGTCENTVLCTARTGWDGPTGWGTLKGLRALTTP